MMQHKMLCHEIMLACTTAHITKHKTSHLYINYLLTYSISLKVAAVKYIKIYLTISYKECYSFGTVL